MNDPPPAELLRGVRPIPTYRGHPATSGRDIAGVDPGGAAHGVGIVRSAEPVLLVFLSSSCLGCRDFWDGTGELRAALPRVRVVVVTRGPDEEDAAAVGALAAQMPPGSAEVVMSSAAYADYGVGGPPFFALAIGAEVRTEGVAWGVGDTADVVRRALTGAGRAGPS
ncbi:MAG: hypothetical protein ACLPVF_16035 [Acidimicrobiales bacterium]